MLFTKLGVCAGLLVYKAAGLPVFRRRVPHEHSHEQFLTTVRNSLNLNNPDNIQDPVFGLLGNAAASAGQGKITDTDCLQQATADQAFTNAKAAGDVDGQVAALIYRALERNTGKVGLASVTCESIKAVNPEIAAIQQHQDSSAGSDTQASNKAITLALAQQIASVGGDPQLALKSGTFAPGDLNDPTAQGGSCDDANDPVGCIFTQNLLVEDATADEINAGVSQMNGTAPSTASASSPASTPSMSASSPAPTSSNSTSTSFGTCTNPTVQFGAGLDNRKATEFSFIPADQAEFKHGSALNAAIIFQFICDNLVNNCGLTNADTTVQNCRSANTAASALGKTGEAADSFNKALGFTTDFAALDPAVSNGTISA